MKKRIQLCTGKRRSYISGVTRLILISAAFQLYGNISTAQTNGQSGAGGTVQQAWVSRYNGPVNGESRALSIAVDNSGFVYATGFTSTLSEYPFNHDYATIKYDAMTGDTLWAVLYDGPADATDEARVIKVDNQGNVYVTGISAGTPMFQAGLDYATIKYNSAGNVIWVSRYDGPGTSTDYANAMAIDDAGNVYVTGASQGSGTGFDYATVKYNSAGEEEWAARYDGPAGGDDEASAIAVDNSGNVYVTGYSAGGSTSLDYATIKYNASGVMEWAARYNGPGNDQDAANDIKIDGSGYIYVTGQSTGSGTGFDYATIKYDPQTGDTIWTKRYNGTDFYYDYARAIAIDSFDDIYVTGYSTSTVSGYDYTTIKYSASGSEEWVARYSSPGSNFDLANAIAADSSGDVYITGEGIRSGSYFEYTTVKYNSSGTEEWVMDYTGPGNEDDEAAAIALDNDENVYVTGYSTGTDSVYDYATLKYGPVETPVELTSFTGDVINGEVVLHWATATESNNKGFDMERQIYTPQGTAGNWETIGFVAGNGTTTDPKAYTFTDKTATGSQAYRLKQVDFDGSFKYSQVVEVSFSHPEYFSLSQNYPNPFNPATRIKFTIPADGKVKLAVYNALGQKAADLLDKEEAAGSYEINFDASGLSSGVYYYRIESNGMVITKKMILLR